jgi:hypothetical protein
MAVHGNYWEDPTLLVGSRFEFTSGDITTQGCRGRVLEVVDAPNAAGKMGKLVIHTLDGEEGKWRTRWSFFREHATLITSSQDGASREWVGEQK